MTEGSLRPLRPTFVTLFDSQATAPVPGFTRGETWSGWACPLLSLEAVRALFGSEAVHVEPETKTLTLTLGPYDQTRIWFEPSPDRHPLHGEPLYDFTGARFAFEECSCRRSPCDLCAKALRAVPGP